MNLKKIYFCIYLFLLNVNLGFAKDSKQSNSDTDLLIKEVQTLTNIINLINKNYVNELSTKDLIHRSIKGLLNELDPHSTFLTKDSYKDLKTNTNGRFGGIGLEVTKGEDFIKVISPILGTPCYKAGIRVGDLIIKVNNISTKA